MNQPQPAPDSPSTAAVAAAWIARFDHALRERDHDSLAALFSADADWRDIVAFTWDFTTTVGASTIAERIVELDASTGANDFTVDETRTAPRLATRAGDEVVEAIYRFRTGLGTGAGVVRLMTVADGATVAKTLLTTLQELDGFEERRGARRPHGTGFSRTFGGANWKDLREQEQAYEDHSPDVLVIGAGQSGLSVGARLRAIGVDSLIVEKLPRVGDVWRQRYHSLTLHNEAWVASLPYLEFPDTWPTYIPKDKLAGWFEYYAEAMELNVWTETEFLGAEYDEANQSWTARVRRGGEELALTPRHIVVGTGGVSGVPNIPSLPGLDTFEGDVMHSSAYTSGSEFAGREALVVGTGTSGHDVAQDLHALGSNATIVQRASTTVVSLEPSGVMVYALYSEGLPIEDTDLIAAANSFPTLVRANQIMAQRMLEADKDLLERLHAVGFRTDIGEDKTGFHLKYNRRGGGYYINVGASDLIADAEIGLLQSDEIETFTPRGVRLTDGTERELDLVVLATGYRNLQEWVRVVFGDAVAERVGAVWGVDQGGEMQNMWRPTGQPGLWFHAGSLAACRANSKYLALQIKADLEKLAPQRSLEDTAEGAR